MRVCASVPSSGKVGSPEKAPLGAPEGASGGLCGGPRASSSAAGPTDWLAYLAALKEAANRNFGAKRYAAAVKEYTKVLQLVEEYLARVRRQKGNRDKATERLTQIKTEQGQQQTWQFK